METTVINSREMTNGMTSIKPLTDQEVNNIKALLEPDVHPIKKAVFLANHYVPRLLMEREYLITALQSSQCGQRAITEFLFHMELVENLKLENQKLRQDLERLKSTGEQSLEATG